MASKNVRDHRIIRLEDILKPGYIPFLGGRPKRDTVIGKEDIENLLIALNTSESLEAFLKVV
jgi:hypothetical protein